MLHHVDNVREIFRNSQEVADISPESLSSDRNVRYFLSLERRVSWFFYWIPKVQKLESQVERCKKCADIVRTFKKIWKLFLSGASQSAPSGHDPQNTVSLSKNRPFHDREPSGSCVSSRIQRKSPKIGPRWIGRLPRVSPGLAPG